MDKLKIYNLIILDASGSMDSIYLQALTGVNETIQTIQQAQKEHDELEQYLTLASFNSGENYLSKRYDALPIADCQELSKDDYKPYGGTALYDAMGTLISELQQKATQNDLVLVTVITDGYENSSKTWSGKQIKGLVEELSQMGWTFTYIGANQDIYAVSEDLGINNCLNYCATESGTSSMFRKENDARQRFYKRAFCSFSAEEGCPDMQGLNYFSEEGTDSSDKTSNKADANHRTTPEANSDVNNTAPEELIPRKWLYYPLLIASFLIIAMVATGLGMIFERQDVFIEGMTGIGLFFVWGLKGTLKAATSKGAGYKPILLYSTTILGYCGFLACIAYWGILLGLVMFLIFVAILWLTYKLFSK